MITIAQYTKDFIVENMGVPATLITNVYNGTDTAKFKRTPEMATEALTRYPCATPDNAFVVGCTWSMPCLNHASRSFCSLDLHSKPAIPDSRQASAPMRSAKHNRCF